MQKLPESSNSTTASASDLSGSGRRVFLEYFHEFVFFHLGADAHVSSRPVAGGIEVFLEHSRVRPCSFVLLDGDVFRLGGEEAREEFLMDVVTRNRR